MIPKLKEPLGAHTREERATASGETSKGSAITSFALFLLPNNLFLTGTKKADVGSTGLLVISLTLSKVKNLVSQLKPKKRGTAYLTRGSNG